MAILVKEMLKFKQKGNRVDHWLKPQKKEKEDHGIEPGSITATSAAIMARDIQRQLEEERRHGEESAWRERLERERMMVRPYPYVYYSQPTAIPPDAWGVSSSATSGTALADEQGARIVGVVQ